MNLYYFCKIITRIFSVIISSLIYSVYFFKWKKPANPFDIIWVHPDQIIRSIEFSKIVKQRRYIFNGIIINGEWGKTDYTVNKLHSVLFEAFKLHFIECIPFEDTNYFQEKYDSEIEIEINAKKYSEKYRKIYNEVRENGFNTLNSLFDNVDDFKVSIASNGDILFMTGKHRLAIAKLMGNNFKMPVKVSHRHTDWQKFRDNLYQLYMDGKLSKEDILEMNHPDLLDLII